MAARVAFVGGNWKMNTDLAGARSLARSVAERTPASGVEVAVFPPFPYLLPVAEELRHAGARVALGAQDLYPAASGAFTGEVSPAMLLDCGATVVLVGHSERRHVVGEPDDLVTRKVDAALAAGMRVVLCVGETLMQRTAGETDEVNERQIRSGLSGIGDGASVAERLVIAYEPVWAIGTGRTATPDDAQRAHAHIRAVLAGMFGAVAAAAIRIQYGGSATAGTAPLLLAQPDVDGALVGGASLRADEFGAIAAMAAHAKA